MGAAEIFNGDDDDHDDDEQEEAGICCTSISTIQQLKVKTGTKNVRVIALMSICYKSLARLEYMCNWKLPHNMHTFIVQLIKNYVFHKSIISLYQTITSRSRALQSFLLYLPGFWNG